MQSPITKQETSDSSFPTGLENNGFSVAKFFFIYWNRILTLIFMRKVTLYCNSNMPSGKFFGVYKRSMDIWHWPKVRGAVVEKEGVSEQPSLFGKMINPTTGDGQSWFALLWKIKYETVYYEKGTDAPITLVTGWLTSVLVREFGSLCKLVYQAQSIMEKSGSVCGFRSWWRQWLV